MSQPLNGVNQNPLVFAQITNGISSPEEIDARVVTSTRVITMTSNMFLHLFYNKPFRRKKGFNFSVDENLEFFFKLEPSNTVEYEETILDLYQGESDGGVFGNFNPRPELITEEEVLTLSANRTWRFNPTVFVAEFFAKSVGVPIDCWTPCSRFQLFRELKDSDRLKYSPECGGARTSVCFMTPGELAKSLHSSDGLSFDINGDLEGKVQLSILFQNDNKNIQPLDFRCRFNIIPTKNE
jgi:hypothetical protein